MNLCKKQQGFTMIEMLITMSLMSLCAMLCTQIIALMVRFPKEDFRAEDSIALQQIQLILAQAQEYEIDGDQLYFQYHGDVFHFEQYGNQMVKRKGFEILLQDVDDLNFYVQGTCIVMEVVRDEASWQAKIACE